MFRADDDFLLKSPTRGNLEHRSRCAFSARLGGSDDPFRLQRSKPCVGVVLPFCKCFTFLYTEF